MNAFHYFFSSRLFTNFKVFVCVENFECTIFMQKSPKNFFLFLSSSTSYHQLLSEKKLLTNHLILLLLPSLILLLPNLVTILLDDNIFIITLMIILILIIIINENIVLTLDVHHVVRPGDVIRRENVLTERPMGVHLRHALSLTKTSVVSTVS